jgi:hypothetical protein
MKITLDRERNLKLNMNSMRYFEEITGDSLFKIGENFSATHLQALVYACLRHEDKELTLEQVGDMIDMDNMQEVSEAIGEMMNNSKKKA